MEYITRLLTYLTSRKLRKSIWIITISLLALLVVISISALPATQTLSNDSGLITTHVDKENLQSLELGRRRVKYISRKRKTATGVSVLKPNTCSESRDLVNWKFNCKVDCPIWNITDNSSSKRKFLHCQCIEDVGYSKIVTSSITNISVIPFRRPCLRDIIKMQCTNNKVVPKIVHYVWLGKKARKFEFQNFLSVFSAYKFIKPCLIFFHGETLPFGSHWEYLLQIIPNIVHVYRQSPEVIYDIKLSHIEHKADIARLEAVLEYGGIYIDTDTIILKSLDALRDFNFTLSKAFDFNLSNGLILSVPNASFANIWFKEYKTYNPKQWGTHSTILPYKLSKIYPDLIHVEEKTFVRPNGGELNMLFKENFDWSKNYAIHLFIRYYRKYEYNIEVIRNLNTTMGSVARYVLFDTKELCIK